MRRPIPLTYARALTGRTRTTRANRKLGNGPVFVAAAINAVEIPTVRPYTLHMTGIVWSVADNIAAGERAVVLTGLDAVLSFLLGAATCAVLANTRAGSSGWSTGMPLARPRDPL